VTPEQKTRGNVGSASPKNFESRYLVQIVLGSSMEVDVKEDLQKLNSLLNEILIASKDILEVIPSEVQLPEDHLAELYSGKLAESMIADIPAVSLVSGKT